MKKLYPWITALATLACVVIPISVANADGTVKPAATGPAQPVILVQDTCFTKAVPSQASVTVTNTADPTKLTAAYAVKLRYEVETITIPDGQSGRVMFYNLPEGTYAVTATGTDGTFASRSFTVVNCNVPVPTTSDFRVKTTLPSCAHATFDAGAWYSGDRNDVGLLLQRIDTGEIWTGAYAMSTNDAVALEAPLGYGETAHFRLSATYSGGALGLISDVTVTRPTCGMVKRAVAVAPTKVDPCGIRQDGVKIPLVTGVSYTVNGREATVGFVSTLGRRTIVRAYAKSGYVLGDATAVWTEEFPNRC